MSVIKNRREKLGMTRKQLAEKMEVTQQTIHNWETFNRQPRIAQLEKLSKVLKVAMIKITRDYL